MIFSRLFQSKKTKWDNSRRYLKSESDLKLLSNQVIYVEGEYSNKVNKVITENYDTISAKLKRSEGSVDFIYLPVIAGQIQKQDVSLRDVLHYYFPNNRSVPVFSAMLTVPRTDAISRHLFSFLPFKEAIKPGLFRYMGRDSKGLFVYEYFPFVSGRKRGIINQLTYYMDTIPCAFQYTLPVSGEIEYHLLDTGGSFFPTGSFGKKVDQPTEDIFDFPSEDHFLQKESITPEYEVPEEKPNIAFSRSEHLRNMETKEVCASDMLSEPSFAAKDLRKPLSDEYALISRIKSDILNLKELGFYDTLLKEIGSMLYEDEKMFQPGRLVIDDDYRIFLPDFDAMEIEMSPLPKTLFILFLRHPGGINLKSLIDYKAELLEIYKLLSYREAYFDMVESISRICNPLEGSINEKLSRIKEAFLKKMSIDTAKHYIVSGERGMKKKIEIDRSLIAFPDAFTEIRLTNTSG